LVVGQGAAASKAAVALPVVVPHGLVNLEMDVAAADVAAADVAAVDVAAADVSAADVSAASGAVRNPQCTFSVWTHFTV
jgi:hypothetical protein